MSLTAKQRRFVEEYCVDFNATKAAERAGYKVDNAYATGFENLRKPEIARRISDRLTLLEREAGVTTASIVEAYRRIGFADVRKALHAIGIELDAELDEETAFAIAGATQTEQDFYDKDGNISSTKRRTEIKMHPKGQALDGLAKIHALFVHRVDVRGEVKHTGIAAVPPVTSTEKWLELYGQHNGNQPAAKVN